MKRPPRGTVLEQCIQDGEQLAHAGDEGHLGFGVVRMEADEEVPEQRPIGFIRRAEFEHP